LLASYRDDRGRATAEAQVLHRLLQGEPVISRRRYWVQDPKVLAWVEALEQEALELEQRGG
jgi:hypothetical protein